MNNIILFNQPKETIIEASKRAIKNCSVGSCNATLNYGRAVITVTQQDTLEEVIARVNKAVMVDKFPNLQQFMK